MDQHAASRAGRRLLTLRRDAVCAVCSDRLPAGTRAVWDRAAGSATCVPCVERPTVDGARPGTAGQSARREAARRDAAHRGASWQTGAVGEEKVGTLLEPLAAEGRIAVLHDRRLPRSRANIDHIVVAASGVWVVDAKRYRGLMEVSRGRLLVDGRDRTNLVAKLGEQRAAVARAVASMPPPEGTVVYGALCFVDTRRRWGRRPRTIDGVLVTWASNLVTWLRDPGPLDQPHRAALQHHLARRFPPATGPG